MEPCPISAPAERIVTAPSGAMRTHALTLRAALACDSETRRMPSAPMTRPNVRPPAPMRNRRRDGLSPVRMFVLMAYASRAAR